MTSKSSARVTAMEEQHVHPETAETHALAIHDSEQLHGLALDACLLSHFFDCDLTR
jgi:hypothetical protein